MLHKLNATSVNAKKRGYILLQRWVYPQALSKYLLIYFYSIIFNIKILMEIL